MFSFRKKSAPAQLATSQADRPDNQSSFKARLQRGLNKTREALFSDIGELFQDRASLESSLEELETRLLMADAGIDATQDIIDELRQQGASDNIAEGLRQILVARLSPHQQSLSIDSHHPTVVLVIGVNGAGKTTTIGKLAKRYQGQGKQVMLAAGDTFRAAAVEQLQAWGERNDVPVVSQATGADSASVIYDAFEAARARDCDILIADTAGRLQNKSNLMEELAKIKRVLSKLDQAAPHEVLLVLDAGTGQNAVSQTQQFHDAIGVTGLALTKLDGTAKGGVLFALARQFDIPVRFIGVGEQAEDLREFIATDFVDALLGTNEAD